eukprot:1608970-Prymnesium_polylepis.1
MPGSAAGLRKGITAARKIHTPPEKAIEAAGLRLTQLANTVLQEKLREVLEAVDDDASCEGLSSMISAISAAADSPPSEASADVIEAVRRKCEEQFLHQAFQALQQAVDCATGETQRAGVLKKSIQAVSTLLGKGVADSTHRCAFHEHELIQSADKSYSCDVLSKTCSHHAAFRCALGCNWFVCQTCFDTAKLTADASSAVAERQSAEKLIGIAQTKLAEFEDSADAISKEKEAEAQLARKKPAAAKELAVTQHELEKEKAAAAAARAEADVLREELAAAKDVAAMEQEWAERDAHEARNQIFRLKQESERALELVVAIQSDAASADGQQAVKLVLERARKAEDELRELRACPVDTAWTRAEVEKLRMANQEVDAASRSAKEAQNNLERLHEGLAARRGAEDEKTTAAGAAVESAAELTSVAQQEVALENEMAAATAASAAADALREELAAAHRQ